jgi:hypothetical protein
LCKNSYLSSKIDKIFSDLKSFQLKKEQMDTINNNRGNHSFNVFIPEKPRNSEKNNMALMLCNSSLPRGTQLPARLIEFILGFIPGSFEPSPPPPPQPQPPLPDVIIDDYDNIWSRCCKCNHRVCISVADDWDYSMDDLISCTLPFGDIRSAICYSCEEDLRFRDKEEFNYHMSSSYDCCLYCGADICGCGDESSYYQETYDDWMNDLQCEMYCD